jgi:hypothetical protein
MSPQASPGEKTWLLFPLITSQAGWDSGIWISNISLDPLGTTPVVGNVRLHFYGDNAPTPYVTDVVRPGTTYALLVSYIAPKFHGYLIAECHFAPARGVAYITGVGNTISEMLLAEVLRIEPA